jgi:hypothetical protein
MWVFYHACYGPGHQSGESDFEYFGNNYQKDDIDESLMRKFDDQDGVVLRWWKVDKPNQLTLNIKKGSAKAYIETYQEYLAIMQRETSFLLNGKDGVDKVIQRNLKKKDTFDVLRRLHKAGFMLSEMDINQWEWGKEWTIPAEPDRSKILRIIRSSKGY